jgi:hypothetical protein
MWLQDDPVRFIAACPDGHIQDVPFMEWVHNGAVTQDGKIHQLYYHSLPGSGDLSSIIIKCSCGIKRSLAGIMNIGKTDASIYNSALAKIGLDKNDKTNFSIDNPNNNNPSGQYCKACRPWLGENDESCSIENCGNHLHVLIRGGSNVHYAKINSAIFLPPVSEDADSYVSDVIEEKSVEYLNKMYNQQKDGSVLKLVLEDSFPVRNNLIEIDDLYEKVVQEITKDDHVQDDLTNIESMEDVKIQEYYYILNGRNSENSEFKAAIKSFDDYYFRDFLNKFFECVVLIERLKETRVFSGFARIYANNKTVRRDLSIKQNIGWLPAYQVYGEGIFLKFKDGKINNWLNSYSSSFKRVIERYDESLRKRSISDNKRKLNPAFIMLHTFAHLLIKRLCFNCGYGSSSLRERIYFNSSEDNQMNGILIYTSSGDSEGSLGGLVRQGKEYFLGKLIKESIEDTRWCSADPVCSDIGQSSGQGPDNVNGSACHNCCIVPETSCEEFNMLLDRATIIGTLDKNIGYFSDR